MTVTFRQWGWRRALMIIFGAQLLFWSGHALIVEGLDPVAGLSEYRLQPAVAASTAIDGPAGAWAPGLSHPAILRVPGWQPVLLHPTRAALISPSGSGGAADGWTLACVADPCGAGGAVYVGPLDRVNGAALRERIQRSDIAWLAIAVAFVLGTALLTLLPISRFSWLQAIAGLFLLLLSADIWLTVFGAVELSSIWYPPLRYGVEYPMLMTMAWTMNAFAGWHGREAQAAGVCCAIAFVVLIGASLTGRNIAGVAAILDAAALTLLLGYGFVALQRLGRAAPGSAMRILALLLVVLVSAAYDLLFHPLLKASVLAAPLVMFGLLFELAIQGRRLNQEADEARSDLERQVLEQDAHLLRSSSLLRHQERRIAIDAERQRLLRDMHDGVGGMLTHLLLEVRARRLGQDGIEQELQLAVDDLRNIASAIDAGNEPIDEALAMFHERMAARLSRSGIAFDWRCALPIPAPGIDARQLLSLYRLLQEGIANALRHADASRIELAAEAAGSDAIAIMLSDDGVGFEPARANGSPGEGRGLANMHRRAGQMGGRLLIESEPGRGTRLVLSVPLPSTSKQ
ncbi:MAG: hypothetical protein JHC57_01505 [Sphingopyxis sp.]|uniref:sensor histidine kinase n=1 Tax=Sphingopyxis sp. TaxID=1908224 RepID=UPI001A2171E7|nr:ATP-binding protein [Sphingopyxis sp.]MBJ7498410.1 hypothetical protein [Sphingopyxis sp.]